MCTCPLLMPILCHFKHFAAELSPLLHWVDAIPCSRPCCWHLQLLVSGPSCCKPDHQNCEVLHEVVQSETLCSPYVCPIL